MSLHPSGPNGKSRHQRDRQRRNGGSLFHWSLKIPLSRPHPHTPDLKDKVSLLNWKLVSHQMKRPFRRRETIVRSFGSPNAIYRLTRNYSQLSWRSAFAKANAIGNNWWFASCVMATSNTPGYYPWRCDTSTAIISLWEVRNDCKHVTKAQKKRLNRSSVVMSIFVTVPGLGLCSSLQ